MFCDMKLPLLILGELEDNITNKIEEGEPTFTGSVTTTIAIFNSRIQYGRGHELHCPVFVRRTYTQQ